MVNFHGYELPIWYFRYKRSIYEYVTRQDYSMSAWVCFNSCGKGSLMVELSIHSRVLSSNRKMRYSHFLDHEGHIIDDMIFGISRKRTLGCQIRPWSTSFLIGFPPTFP